MTEVQDLPTLEGDLVANVVSINLSGKFKGQEIKELSQSFINYLITKKNMTLIFGQQANFRLARIPPSCEAVGTQRVLMIYNKKYLQANDETQYKHFLRDLELRGRLPRYYLPENNYTLCKVKSKVIHDVSFLAMSWFTDETKDTLLCLNLLRKVLSFAANLCAIEEMPVVIGGTFRLTLEEIKHVVYNEFEGFRCYGYKSLKSRRQARMGDVFISCPPLRMDEVKPIVCSSLQNMEGGVAYGRWFNPEEAFYWDPVFGQMNLRPGTSTLNSPASPRVLSPLMNENLNPFPNGYLHNECSYVPSNRGDTFESAELTLKKLLEESERIKRLVSEAEIKSKNILGSSHFENILQKEVNGLEGKMDDEEEDEEEKALKKTPSYEDLYDEELIETNNACYMQ